MLGKIRLNGGANVEQGSITFMPQLIDVFAPLLWACSVARPFDTHLQISEMLLMPQVSRQRGE